MSIRTSKTRRRPRGPVLVPLLILAAIVGAAVLVRAGGDVATDAEPSPRGSVTIQVGSDSQLSVGDSVPAFSAPSLDGSTLAWQEFTGAPTVLAVWASWCPHCQAELPVLDAVAADFPDVRVATVVTAVRARPGPSPTARRS